MGPAGSLPQLFSFPQAMCSTLMMSPFFQSNNWALQKHLVYKKSISILWGIHLNETFCNLGHNPCAFCCFSRGNLLFIIYFSILLLLFFSRDCREHRWYPFGPLETAMAWEWNAPLPYSPPGWSVKSARTRSHRGTSRRGSWRRTQDIAHLSHGESMMYTESSYALIIIGVQKNVFAHFKWFLGYLSTWGFIRLILLTVKKKRILHNSEKVVTVVNPSVLKHLFAFVYNRRLLLIWCLVLFSFIVL